MMMMMKGEGTKFGTDNIARCATLQVKHTAGFFVTAVT